MPLDIFFPHTNIICFAFQEDDKMHNEPRRPLCSASTSPSTNWETPKNSRRRVHPSVNDQAKEVYTEIITCLQKLAPTATKSDPLFGLPPRTMDWIPVGDPKQRRRRRSGLLVRLRRRAHRLPLLSILFANVQSLDNKVDEIRARIAFQRDISDCNILSFTDTWLTRDSLWDSVEPPGFFTHHSERNKHLSGKKKGGGVCLMINESWCATYRNSSPFVHLT